MAHRFEGSWSRPVAELGSVDILVNNAAFAMAGDRVPVVELDDALWHRVLDIKIHGSYCVSKAAAQAMMRQGTGGSIVMISSIAGKIQPRNFAAYVVANMGLQGLTGRLVERVGPVPDQRQLRMSQASSVHHVGTTSATTPPEVARGVGAVRDQQYPWDGRVPATMWLT